MCFCYCVEAREAHFRIIILREAVVHRATVISTTVVSLSRKNRSGTKTGPGGPIMAGDNWSPLTITSPRWSALSVANDTCARMLKG